ncbi:hypothetical protein NDN08_007536 [Rhodosorus marinus]|uniref:Phosphatidylserine synthase n=1 Tax=Rhodosorus marinus TaxID=101924 RepID=A0AAV8UY48_9RHOD|nr:hypothetical protein NDN08_007536 [Rhodosorus marinus]
MMGSVTGGMGLRDSSWAASVITGAVLSSLVWYFGDWSGSPVVCSLFMASVVFISIWLLLVREDFFCWPHPALWRVVMAASILYSMLLTCMFWLPPKQARMVLNFVDPSVGISPAPHEKGYGENCALTFGNVRDIVNDVFFLAHLLGWCFKALIMRNRSVLWIQSITFELIEESVKSVLPNFNECWWDRWVLDVLLCNFVGMEIGLFLINRFAEPFNWFTLTHERARPPHEESRVPSFLTSREHFLTVCFVVGIGPLVDLINFLLKAALFIPAESPLVLCNLLLVGLPCLVGVPEIYATLSVSGHFRIGSQGAVLLYSVLMELALSWKLSSDTFPANGLKSIPVVARALWTLALLLLLGFTAMLPFGRNEPVPGSIAKKRKVF